MKKETIIGIFLALMTIWAIGFTVPKLYEIWKDSNFKTEEKTDTVIQKDTLWLEATVTDSLPKAAYQTVTQRDTIYKVKGDSIEQQPRIILTKKKLTRTPLDWKDKTLYLTRRI